jgi:hypothetical protein
MLDRFNRSWQVAKESYAVLCSNPSLVFFPFASGAAAVFVSLPFIGLLIAFHPHHGPWAAAHYAIVAAMYFADYFAIIFFNSALVACAHENLNGRPSSVRFGIEAASKRLPQIFCWALIASTVGLVLRFIGERTGIIGRIVTSLIGLVWNIAVYFVVPCMVVDNEGPVTALKTSTGLIKRTWGERLILGVGVGSALAVFFLMAIIPILLAVAAP